MTHKRKRSHKVLLPIFAEAMDGAWAVIKKHDLNWTETLLCFRFMGAAFEALMMQAKGEAGIPDQP